MFPALPAAAAAAFAHAPAPSLPAAELFDINGAKLGMSLADWQALPRPGPDADHVATACKPVVADAERLQCRYVVRYGAYQLPVSFPLVGSRRIRRPVFEFVGGRLAAIRFRTTTDAFNQLMTVLQRGYGAPQTIVRDSVRVEGVTLPRIRATWRGRGETVTLTDPSSNPDRLEVELGAG